jgi:hypothetical protein
MQFTTKLFTAFLALIALMQFVSGATTYSEMKDDTKITVGVSGVAKTDGCAPTVNTLNFFLLPENLSFLLRSSPNEGARACERYREKCKTSTDEKTFSARDSLAGDPFSSSRAMFDSLAHLRKKVTKGHFGHFLRETTQIDKKFSHALIFFFFFFFAAFEYDNRNTPAGPTS